MKTISIVLALGIFGFLHSNKLFAQRDTTHVETLFGNKNLDAKIYGLAQIGTSQMNKTEVMLTGLGVGVTFKKKFSIGIQANGIFRSGKVEEIYFSKYGDTYTAVVKAYYGGVKFEYKIQPKKLFHVGFPLVVGSGKIIYQTDRKYYNYGNKEFYRKEIDSDMFTYVEPGINLEINLASFVRMGFVVSYRFTKVELVSTSTDAFRASSFNFNLCFGKI